MNGSDAKSNVKNGPPARARFRIAGRYLIRAMSATARRVLLENLRAYQWGFFANRLLTSFFSVTLAFLLYNVLFNRQIDASFQAYTGSTDYLTFTVIGVSIQAYVQGALLNVGRSLIGERRAGTLEGLFLAPAPHSAYLLGVMLQQTLLTTLDFLVILAISIPFGANYAQTNWLALALILLIAHIGFLGMAVILGAVMLYLRNTYLTQNTVLAILLLICGVLFPVEYLPDWVQRIAAFIPLTHALRLARGNVLLGRDLAQQAPEFLGLLLLSVVYCVVGLLLVGRVRKIALEEALS